MLIYTMGDIHGSYQQMLTMFDLIEQHIQKNPEQDAKIVCLGDYVDRGPASYDVVEFLRTYNKHDLVCLKGNHEDMFIEAIMGDTGLWLSNGGHETAVSYHFNCKERTDLISDLVPTEHFEWLNNLPLFFSIDNGDTQYVFVHAGIDRSIPMHEQKEGVLLWTRSHDFMRWKGKEKIVVVHGHTPTAYDPMNPTEFKIQLKPDIDPDELIPVITENRINLDTGCVYGGKLSCAIIDLSEEFSDNVTMITLPYE